MRVYNGPSSQQLCHFVVTRTVILVGIMKLDSDTIPSCAFDPTPSSYAFEAHGHMHLKVFLMKSHTFLPEPHLILSLSLSEHRKHFIVLRISQ